MFQDFNLGLLLIDNLSRRSQDNQDGHQDGLDCNKHDQNDCQ